MTQLAMNRKWPKNSSLKGGSLFHTQMVKNLMITYCVTEMHPVIEKKLLGMKKSAKTKW